MRVVETSKSQFSSKMQHHFIDGVQGNPGWADAMARILTKQLPDDKVTQLYNHLILNICVVNCILDVLSKRLTNFQLTIFFRFTLIDKSCQPGVIVKIDLFYIKFA